MKLPLHYGSECPAFQKRNPLILSLSSFFSPAFSRHSFFRRLSGSLAFAVLIALSACGGGSSGGGGAGAPALTNGTLTSTSYEGTQSPGDLWTWTISGSNLTGTDQGPINSTGGPLPTLSSTNNNNGYYELSGNSYTAFAVEQGDWLSVWPVGGPVSPTVSFNPIFMTSPGTCAASGTTNYNINNVVNSSAPSTASGYIQGATFNAGTGTLSGTLTVSGGSSSVSISGLTCSGGVWSGTSGLTIVISSSGLMIGDLGTNASTGFPSGTTGFVGFTVPSSTITASSLNGDNFVWVGETQNSTSGNTAGGSPNSLAGETAQGTAWNYASCGNYTWSSSEEPTMNTHPGNNLGTISFTGYTSATGIASSSFTSNCTHTPSGPMNFAVGQLANGKLVLLPQNTGGSGPPIMVQE